jgi:hypothetical protein
MRAQKFKRVRLNFSAGAWLPILAGLSLAARADENPSEQEAFDRYFRLPAVSQQNNWNQHFSLGAAVGFNISAKFNESGIFNLPGSSLPGGVYDGSGNYVLPDLTGSSSQTTYNWGYQSASQYNAALQTLSMYRTQSYQTTGSGSRDEGGPFPGFELDYGGNLHQWQNFRLGWDLGFSLVPMSIADHSLLSASNTQTTAVFSTAGIQHFPGPGYHGTFNGPGKELPLQPESSSSTLAGGTVGGSRRLDSILYGLRLGPTFYWDFSRNWTVSLSGGPAVGVVSANYYYNEVITTLSTGSSAENNGSFHGLDVVYGGYVNATLLYHMADAARPVDLYLSAQYMPLGSADFNQGGRDASLDLSGQIYVSAGVNWPF